MTSFVDFCSARGLILENLSLHRWVRTKTVDHPKKRNGAYYFAGDFGHVQNWATMESAETWFADRVEKTDPNVMRRLEESRQREDAKRDARALAAEQRAEEMLKSSTQYTHPYLAEKGRPNVKANVIDQTLLVRMENEDGHLVGLQTIEMVDGVWVKKMLNGMRAKGASMTIGRGRTPILCEGYATGLSIDAALRMSPSDCCVVVCFSAGNIIEVSKHHRNGLVFADNDASNAGQEAAEKSGLPWVMSDTVGEDANDLYRRAPMLLAWKLTQLRNIRLRK